MLFKIMVFFLETFKANRKGKFLNFIIVYNIL